MEEMMMERFMDEEKEDGWIRQEMDEDSPESFLTKLEGIKPFTPSMFSP